MDFFSNQAGVAVLVPDGGMPMALSLQNWDGRAMKACLSGIAASASVNMQFMHTLRNLIHFDTFGDRISEMRVSILAFSADCNPDGRSGIDSSWQYYLQNKASTRGAPLALAIGAKLKFSGFLDGLDMGAADPIMGISQFTFRFHFVPPEAR